MNEFLKTVQYKPVENRFTKFLIPTQWAGEPSRLSVKLRYRARINGYPSMMARKISDGADRI